MVDLWVFEGNVLLARGRQVLDLPFELKYGRNYDGLNLLFQISAYG